MTVPHIRDYQGKRIHMIGIGGSSMSGLAQMLKEKGYIVSGSDNLETYTTRHLRDDLHIPVTIGHRAENVHGADLVVYTVAILPDNPERVELERLGLPSIERATLLGQLMEGFDTAIGVCGAHGKTTTTSMLSQVLMECGMDPSIHIGGSLDFIGGSTHIGRSGMFVAEACEFNASFLHLRPTVAVVLNIDADHLDFYRDIDHIEETFGKFLALLPPDGTAIGNGDDKRIMRLFSALSVRRLTFGLGEGCDYTPGRLTYDEYGHASFDLCFHGDVLGQITLQVPGEFQVYNALAALACAHSQGADMAMACHAMNEFKGAHRRFELTGEVEGVKLYHDYGHNPTEMRNVLSVARLQPHGRLWAVMQPHTYSRVKRLFDDYLTCTQAADFTLVTDIYAAREKDPGDIKASQIVEGMRAHGVNAVHTPTFDDTEAYLRAHWQPGDLVLTMGCGNINQLNDQIADTFTQGGQEILGGDPACVLFVGINGTGKTTTVGKLAKEATDAGRTVLLGSADTFRAAAIEQLEVWANRADVEMVTRERGADPASVCYDTIERAEAEDADLVLIDTAGRLHTSADLMRELAKVVNVVRKRSKLPVYTVLVIDATTGQNGLQQAREFNRELELDALIVTKLDGTAKGGIALAVSHELELPIIKIGVGEGLDDLRDFDAHDFARALVGAFDQRQA